MKQDKDRIEALISKYNQNITDFHERISAIEEEESRLVPMEDGYCGYAIVTQSPDGKRTYQRYLLSTEVRFAYRSLAELLREKINLTNVFVGDLTAASVFKSNAAETAIERSDV